MPIEDIDFTIKDDSLIESLTSLQPDYYLFSAVRGIQAEREYYIAMCRLGLLHTLFQPAITYFLSHNIKPADERSQRKITKARIPKMKKYIINNLGGYVFPAITASIDGDVKFKPLLSLNTAIEKEFQQPGFLLIPRQSSFAINDGQHRICSLMLALEENRSLRNETIGIVFFVDAGLKRSQQMFADLNRHAIRPTNSLTLLYDVRNEFSRFTVRLMDKIPVFRKRIEIEKASISPSNPNFFTLNALNQAFLELVGKKRKRLTDQDELTVFDYWSAVTENITEWQSLLNGETTTQDLRKSYVHAHGVILSALAIVGRSLVTDFPDWKNKLEKLCEIDWSRSNPEWEGRAFVNGRMAKAVKNIQLSANLIKTRLDIPLSEKEEKLEEEFKEKRANPLPEFFGKPIHAKSHKPTEGD
ncbi:MAG: DNA sulfur modification protein DndB [Candidatus Odinarchaeota archaeon]